MPRQGLIWVWHLDFTLSFLSQIVVPTPSLKLDAALAKSKTLF